MKPIKNVDLTYIRTYIRDVVEEYAVSRKKTVIGVAIDGIRYSDAISNWNDATQIIKVNSVFPTTSSSCWLSAATGSSVIDHGCVGVVFKKTDTADVLNIFTCEDGLIQSGEKTFFHDVSDLGVTPIALLSDLGNLKCGWRDRLLNGSKLIESPLHFHSPDLHSVPDALERLNADIKFLHSQSLPSFGWIFVDVDKRIHRYGYDSFVFDYLKGFNKLATEWAERGAVIVAYSDHGLVRTNHSIAVADTVALVTKKYNLSIGGAGRIRWLYLNKNSLKEAIISELTTLLPSTIEVAEKDKYFDMNSPMADRIGEILLIARSDEFLTEPGVSFDHGSNSEDEWHVPLAIWGA